MNGKLKKRLVRQLSVVSMALATSVNMMVPAAAANNDNSPGIQPNSKNQEAQKPKTNVIYIVLDDMGFSDLGCYGSEIKTPNIDKLAANGLRYNTFTTCPVCSPTRASLLTGRDNNAVGMGNLADIDFGETVPSTRGRITDRAATVAQILKTNGYSTFAVGKWHVAPTHQITPAGPFDYWPLAKGFERFYGYLNGETDQNDPQLSYDNHFVQKPKKKGYQLSADLVDMAEQFVTDQVSVTPDKPFFLYAAFSATHSPLQAPKEYIDMYNGVYDKGWDKIREERFDRQKKMGIIPANAELTARDPNVKSWDSLSPDEKKVCARFEEVFAGYLTYTDSQIGRLMDYLKAIGQFDNTMIVLISDNGATGYGGNEGTDYEMKLSRPSRSESHVNEYLKRINDIGGPDFAAFYPRGWAMVSDTPFKGFKGSVYAGGTREPLVVHWPAGIKAKGEVRDQAVYVTDITPTVLNVMNIETPKVFQGIDQMPMHGVSFANTFDNGAASTEHTVHYDLIKGRLNLQTGGGNRSITQDGWKAISSERDAWLLAKRTTEPNWELYNLSEDYSENHDLAEVYPDKLNEMKALWTTEAEKYGAALKPVKPGKTDAVNNRNTYKYLPGMGGLENGAIPKVFNRSYTITVPISRSKESQQGVLVAHGDEFAGYTLYVQNNQLIYEFNCLGNITRVVSTEKIPLGSTVLKFQLAKTGKNTGIARIYINDKVVGEKVIPNTNWLSLEGLSIGRDSHSPVSSSYKNKGEFAFDGKYDYVLFELAND